MGYDIKSVGLGRMGISGVGRGRYDVVECVRHDFRLYEAEGYRLPRHINGAKSGRNVIVYVSDFFELYFGKSGERFSYFLGKDRKGSSRVRRFISGARDVFFLGEEEYQVSKVGWRGFFPFVGFVIHFSKKAQKDIEEGIVKEEDLISVTERFVRDFEKIIGVKVYYCVLHLDESAPHFHILATNLREYNGRDIRSIRETEEWKYLVRKYGLEGELEERLLAGKGRLFMESFVSKRRVEDELKEIEEIEDEAEKEERRKRFFRVELGFLQDLVGKGYEVLGFQRGKKMEERLAEGEPLWKLISRQVKELHEDLPKEIELEREKLKGLVQVVKELEERKAELEEELREIEESVEDAREEAKRQVREIRDAILLEKEELKREISYLEEERDDVEKELKELKEEVEKERAKVNEVKRIRFLVEGSLSVLKREKELLEEEIRKLREEIEKRRKEKEEEVKKLTREAERLREEILFLRRAREEFTSREILFLKDVLPLCIEGAREVVFGKRDIRSFMRGVSQFLEKVKRWKKEKSDVFRKIEERVEKLMEVLEMVMEAKKKGVSPARLEGYLRDMEAEVKELEEELERGFGREVWVLASSFAGGGELKESSSSTESPEEAKGKSKEGVDKAKNKEKKVRIGMENKHKQTVSK